MGQRHHAVDYLLPLEEQTGLLPWSSVTGQRQKQGTIFCAASLYNYAVSTYHSPPPIQCDILFLKIVTTGYNLLQDIV